MAWHPTNRLWIALILIMASSSSLAARLLIGPKSLITSPRQADYVLSDEGATLAVCYDWSCSAIERIQFATKELTEAIAAMNNCKEKALHDRLQRLRIGVWQLELLAQRHIPVLANDREVNDRDADFEGRMDCVDNASNTTTYLSILSDLGALPGWSVGEPEVRDLFSRDVHWTATVMDTISRERWAVDSWYRPNGHLPFVSPISDWTAARKAWETPLDRYNPYPRTIDRLCPKNGSLAQSKAIER